MEEHLTSPGTAVGTVAYRSPEQVRAKQLDARTDLFSFGAVLYEMATGALPFRGESTGVVFNAILERLPVPPVRLNLDLPVELERIINKCLEKDRNLRYQHAADVRTDLQRLKRDSESKSVGVIEQTLVRRNKRVPWIATFLAIAILAVLAGYTFVHHRSPNTQLVASSFQGMHIVNLTDNGNVGNAAISPDARYVAYDLREAGRSSLWIRQVATESTVELVAPSDGSYIGITFSPDGEYLYFVHDRKGNATFADAYAIPALGGTPRLALQNVDSALGLSPEGKRLTFVRGLDASQSQLLLANNDGTDEQVIVDFVKTKVGMVQATAAPSWSPDGKLIALVVSRPSGNAIFVCPAAGGEPVLVPFDDASSASWLPDQSGMLVQASGQIWQQPFPKGKPQRITNDLNRYGSVRLTADGKRFAAVQALGSSTIFIGAASTPDKGVPINASHTDGYGLAWMPDGRLLSMDLGHHFWLASAEGKDRIATLHGVSDVRHNFFSICGDSKFRVLTRVIGNRLNVWRIDPNGRNFRQLTESGLDMHPDCSPDGNWVIYSLGSDRGERLMRIQAIGGSPKELLQKRFVVGRYSPDGRRIGIVFMEGEAGNERGKLSITDSDAQVIRTFDLPGSLPDNGWQWVVRWTPDGQALTFPVAQGDVINLWIQPVSGGKPRQITHFPDSVIAYAWSPDGKRLALTRSTVSSDVVLFSDFH